MERRCSRSRACDRRRHRVSRLPKGFSLEGRAPGEGTSSGANADSSSRLGRWDPEHRVRYIATPNARHEPTLLGVGSMPWFGGCLQPATDRGLIGQVLRREAGLQVLLLSRDYHERHQRHRWYEGDEEPETVDPECDAELEQRER
jgi:hypothetical protein